MSYLDIDIPYQSDNPTDEQRHTMLRFLLANDRRPEDLENLIELLSPPPDITTICPKGYGKKVRVAVIGAGEAGLSAAFELRKIGCNITIFEATDRVGGRILTHYFDKNKRYFGELGAMRIPVSHETSWHYINLFKLNTRPFVTNNRNGLFYLRDARAVNDPQGLSVMQNIYPEYNLRPDERDETWYQLGERVHTKYLHSLPPEERRELIEVKPFYSPRIRESDMMNRRMAYERAGLSQHAIDMLGYLILVEQDFFRLNFIEELQELYTEDFAFTYYVDGGMTNVPLSLYNALYGGADDVYGKVSRDELGTVKFKMGFPVDGIYKSHEGDGIILEYKDYSRTSRLFEEFDYVVCAIPFSSLRRMKVKPLFSQSKTQAIAELNYENAQKTFLFLKDRFWEMGHPCTRIVGGSTLTNLPVISLFYPSDHAAPVPGVYNGWTLRPGTSPFEPGALLASYNWSMDAERLGNEHDRLKIDDIKGYIEEIHGLPHGYLDDKLIDYTSVLWSREQYIFGGASIMKPEDKSLFSYVVTQPEMDNRVFFAGEHISQKHAWQQGALQTGMIAANQIAQAIKARKS